MKKTLSIVATAVSIMVLAAGAVNGQNKGGVGTSKSFHGPMGLQLYSLRTTFATNVAQGLKMAHDFGFVEVELAGTYNLSPEQFREQLKSNGLKPISGLWDYNMFANDLDTVVGLAKAMGVQYAGCAWIPHDGAFTEKGCREAAAVFNRAGEALAKHGIRFVYHNHGYEFQPYKNGTLMDLLIGETNPKYVSFEMDILWTHFPAQDPVALLKKYPGRWPLMHVKDLRKGVATGALTGSTDVTNDVSIGSGQLAMPAIMRAAQETGVKHYFIEDESPIPTQQIPQSLKYLESLSW